MDYRFKTNVLRSMGLGIDIVKFCCWDAPVAKTVGKGKSHGGKMDAILAVFHLYSKLKLSIMLL